MSLALCATCKQQWDASASPLCVQCECERLVAAPNLINDKHDPRLPPFVGAFYRSCLSHDFVENTKQYVAYATAHGSWFYSTVYESWNHFTAEPLGRAPGLGIHPGEPMPDHELDGLLFADALDDPHAYAVDEARVREQIRDGTFIPLSRCTRKDCERLCVPGVDDCALHADPPLAYPVE